MTKKIFIAEGVPSINKGEGAILWGILESLNVLGDIDVSLCTDAPEIDRKEYGDAVRLIVDNVPKPEYPFAFAILALRHLLFLSLYLFLRSHVTKVMRAPLWREYLSADLIILGHDNRLVGRGPVSLLFVVLVTKILKKPSMVYAGTVGPFSDKLSRWSAKYILQNVHLITLRESKSLETVQSLGIDESKVTIAADTAFLMPPVDSERVDQILHHEKIEQDRPLVGLTITQRMAERYAKTHSPGDIKAGYDGYMQLIASVLDFLVDEIGVSIVILNHCTGPEATYDDRIASRDVVSFVKNQEYIHIVENDYTARELKGVIGRFDFLIGHRTHSMIAALSLHVPVIAMSSRKTGSKTWGIVGDMLHLQEWILEIDTVDEKQFCSMVKSLWERRVLIREHLTQNIPLVQERAKFTGEKAKNLLV